MAWCQTEGRPPSKLLMTHLLSAYMPWWRHQMKIFSALLATCAGNSPVPGEFPTQRPLTRSFDVFFHLRLNKRLSKQSWGWWFETLSRPLWRHLNAASKWTNGRHFADDMFKSILWMETVTVWLPANWLYVTFGSGNGLFVVGRCIGQ